MKQVDGNTNAYSGVFTLQSSNLFYFICIVLINITTSMIIEWKEIQSSPLNWKKHQITYYNKNNHFICKIFAILNLKIR